MPMIQPVHVVHEAGDYYIEHHVVVTEPRVFTLEDGRPITIENDTVDLFWGYGYSKPFLLGLQCGGELVFSTEWPRWFSFVNGNPSVEELTLMFKRIELAGGFTTGNCGYRRVLADGTVPEVMYLLRKLYP